MPCSLLPTLLVGVLGDRAVNGVVHRLRGKRRLGLPFAGGRDWPLLGGVFWLEGLEGWEWLLLLVCGEGGDVICGFQPVALIVEPRGLPEA